LGIVQIATDSDGQTFSGAGIEANRQWYAKRRATLQSVGTKSAKRRLKKLSGKQKAFQRNSNHCISKSIVEKAKAISRAIAIESLKGISKNVRKDAKRLRQTQRAKHSNWSFDQLKQFTAYKCQLYGVVLTTIDPRNTSRTCNQCGHCEKANRRSQAEFVCRSCFHSDSADVNAAKNIKVLGYIRLPIVSGVSLSGTSPRALAGSI
jgi:putative transposase